MKVAAIDIGTNSLRLLVGRQKRENFETLFRLAEITRLGEKVNKTKAIKKEAARRTLKTLTQYQHILATEGVKKVKVAGTEVLREAKNAPSFLDQVKKRTGFEVEILPAQEEARLSFLGASSDYRLPTMDYGLTLVIDIGGGSTELILGEPQRRQGLKIFSLRVGSVRLTEMFIKSDPPTFKEIEHIKEYIDKVLSGPAEQIKKTKDERPARHRPTPQALAGGRRTKDEMVAVGVAGTITTLAAIKQKLKVYDWRKIHNTKLSRSDINKALTRFLTPPLAERKKIIGLEPARADVIIAGTLILLKIMEALNLKELTVSEHDLLDGLLLSIFKDDLL